MAFMFLRETIEHTGNATRRPGLRSRCCSATPALHAVMWHKLSHGLWRRGFWLLGRFSSHIARWLTGIEIHPAARLGRRLVIDHGMGVVIGETAEIGDDCYLYHQVTLGVARTDERQAASDGRQQRHHRRRRQGAGTDHVGDNARIGSNAVVVEPVPPDTTVVGIPARPVDRAPAAAGAAFRPVRHAVRRQPGSAAARPGRFACRTGRGGGAGRAAGPAVCATVRRRRSRSMQLSTRGRYAVMAMVDLAARQADRLRVRPGLPG